MLAGERHPVVGASFGQPRACDPEGVQARSQGGGNTQALELPVQHAAVERKVVRSDAGTVDAQRDIAGNVGEGGSAGDHRRRDPVDEAGPNVSLGLDERLPDIDYVALKRQRDQRDLDHPVGRVDARRLRVDDHDPIRSASRPLERAAMFPS